MQIIKVIRSLPYSYQVQGLDLYDSFDVVATRKIDPKILQPTECQVECLRNAADSAEVVYASDTRRAHGTASFLRKQVITTKLLREVKYSMDDFLDKNSFYEMECNVAYARKKFFRGYADNRLRETHAQVVQRIEQLFAILEQDNIENIVLVSHGFFIKLIEAYVRLPDFRTDPKKLFTMYDGDRPTYGFAGGICLNRNHGIIQFNQTLEVI